MLFYLPGTRKKIVSTLFFKEYPKWFPHTDIPENAVWKPFSWSHTTPPPLFPICVIHSKTWVVRGRGRRRISESVRGACHVTGVLVHQRFTEAVILILSQRENASVLTRSNLRWSTNYLFFFNLKYTMRLKHICVRQITGSDRGLTLKVQKKWDSAKWKFSLLLMPFLKNKRS